MLVAALASQFAGALALASVTSTAGTDVTWLTIFSVIAGLASAFIFVGSQMLLHGVAPGEHLQRVVSLDAATMSVSRIAGPALGGILLAAIGIPPVFLIAAFCYLPLLAVVPILAAGGAGVLLMLGIGACLISILRHEAAAPPAVPEMAKTPGS